MSWQNIKKLQEERAQHLAAIKALRKTADDEKRDLNETEAKTFDELTDKFEKAGTELTRCMKVADFERQSKEELEQRRQQPGRDDLDTPEKRAEAQKLEQRQAFDKFLRNGTAKMSSDEVRALTIQGVGGVVGDR